MERGESKARPGRDLSRRSFLKAAALTGSLLATDACHPQSGTKLIPYLVPETDVVPGVPAFYKSACRECGAGCGVVARVREGRIIKLEGNPENPINAGALCARGQAALQGLYNPDRLPRPHMRAGGATHEQVSWERALEALASHCKDASGQANRVAFLGEHRGLSFDKVLKAFLGSFNSDALHYYEPLFEAAAVEATKSCFGRSELPRPRIDQAEVLVSFGADFLETWRSPLELARQYAAFRAPKRNDKGERTIGTSYYVGPRTGLTAAKCDYTLRCVPGTESMIVFAMLYALHDRGLIRNAADAASLGQFVASFEPGKVPQATGVGWRQIEKMAEDFAGASGALALGGTDDPAVHIGAYLLNSVTGNLNKTLQFAARDSARPNRVGQAGLDGLIKAMGAGSIEVLIVAGSNPVFTTSSGLQFKEALKQVPLVVWCGGVPDETAQLADLWFPIHHTLEGWTDNELGSGIFVLGQPAMTPVFYSKSLGDILLQTMAAAGRPAQWPDFAALVKDSWSALGAQYASGESKEDFWAAARRVGGLFLEPQPAAVELNPAIWHEPLPVPQASDHLSFVAYPHIFLYDGRGADKPWLQENPEPVAQIVWNSWLDIHPETAGRLGISPNELVEVSSSYGKIEIAARLDPRINPHAVAAPLGQGHTTYGRYARNRGANPWEILPPGKLSVAVKLRPTGAHARLVSPLYNSDMMDRPIVETISLDDLMNGRKPPPDEPPPPEPYELWPGRVFPEHHWGMTIDLNSCTGCGACVTACYAENNLYIAGEEGVRNGRIMSWLRLERYFPEKLDAPQIYLMPMLCQQCGSAPCEPVCPVYASYHTAEGLNAQIYNRCVGTRYCENNCPYKVRRFNWFKPEFPAPLELQLNPDVTVRGAGVMEKCTFCVQRIRAAEITATIQNRGIRDGEITPACAQTCASHAIIFGDMNDAGSEMMRARQDNAIRNYRAWDSLNTKPSITYLRTVFRPRET